MEASIEAQSARKVNGIVRDRTEYGAEESGNSIVGFRPAVHVRLTRQCGTLHSCIYNHLEPHCVLTAARTALHTHPKVTPLPDRTRDHARRKTVERSRLRHPETHARLPNGNQTHRLNFNVCIRLGTLTLTRESATIDCNRAAVDEIIESRTGLGLKRKLPHAIQKQDVRLL